MNKVRKKFTRWYYKKGYRMHYDGLSARFDCPWWVNFALFLFSPSEYFVCVGDKFVDGFCKAMMSVKAYESETGG